MSDIAERMRSWRVGELDGLDELIVGDLQDGAAEIEQLRELVEEMSKLRFYRVAGIDGLMQRVREARRDHDE